MISVDLIVYGENDDEPVWSGRLPEVPSAGDRIDLNVGQGPSVWVPDRPARWRLKDYAHGGTNRDHDVASVAVAVEWLLP